MEGQTKLGKYALRFGVVYLVLLVGLAIISGIFEIDLNSGASI